MSSRSRIRQCRRQGRQAAVLLFGSGVVVVTQAVSESQLTGDLPGILSEQGDEMLSGAQVRGRIHRTAVHQTQQETGVGESHRLAANGRRLGVQLRGLIGGESERAVRGGQRQQRVTEYAHFAAEFEGVVALDPGEGRLEGRRHLIRDRLRADASNAGSHVHHSARPEARRSVTARARHAQSTDGREPPADVGNAGEPDAGIVEIRVGE